jgi:hypothetical protein
VTNEFRVKLYLKQKKTVFGLKIKKLLGSKVYGWIANNTFRKQENEIKK